MATLSWTYRFAVLLAIPFPIFAESANGPYPIVFVTPIEAGDSQRNFGDQSDREYDGSRQGLDLCIRYPDGRIRNLTAEAGYAENSSNAMRNIVAIRDPAVSWDGRSIVFSMKLHTVATPEVFQLYRATGFEENAKTRIERIESQPDDRENTNAVINTDGTVFFSSDLKASANGLATSAPPSSGSTPTGIWRIEPATGQAGFVKHLPPGPIKLTWNAAGAVDPIGTNASAPRNLRVIRRTIPAHGS